jgi:hypothetical protein
LSATTRWQERRSGGQAELRTVFDFMRQTGDAPPRCIEQDFCAAVPTMQEQLLSSRRNPVRMSGFHPLQSFACVDGGDGPRPV